MENTLRLIRVIKSASHVAVIGKRSVESNRLIRPRRAIRRYAQSLEAGSGERPIRSKTAARDPAVSEPMAVGRSRQDRQGPRRSGDVPNIRHPVVTVKCRISTTAHSLVSPARVPAHMRAALHFGSGYGQACPRCRRNAACFSRQLAMRMARRQRGRSAARPNRRATWDRSSERKSTAWSRSVPRGRCGRPPGTRRSHRPQLETARSTGCWSATTDVEAAHREFAVVRSLCSSPIFGGRTAAVTSIETGRPEPRSRRPRCRGASAAGPGLPNRRRRPVPGPLRERSRDLQPPREAQSAMARLVEARGAIVPAASRESNDCMAPTSSGRSQLAAISRVAVAMHAVLGRSARSRQSAG